MQNLSRWQHYKQKMRSSLAMSRFGNREGKEGTKVGGGLLRYSVLWLMLSTGFHSPCSVLCLTIMENLEGGKGL